MKIGTIKPLLTRGAIWTAILTGWAVATKATYQEVERMNERKLEAQRYLRQNAPHKYIQLVGENIIGDKRWVEGAKEARDSIRMDSIAKTNYALGMQAAKDSLANINKK